MENQNMFMWGVTVAMATMSFIHYQEKVVG